MPGRALGSTTGPRSVVGTPMGDDDVFVMPVAFGFGNTGGAIGSGTGNGTAGTCVGFEGEILCTSIGGGSGGRIVGALSMVVGPGTTCAKVTSRGRSGTIAIATAS